mgnify:CR=1 FL=1
MNSKGLKIAAGAVLAVLALIATVRVGLYMVSTHEYREPARATGVDATPRPFDIPWLVLDSAKAARLWNWRPASAASVIFEEIASHARAHPQWLEVSAPL